MAQLPENRTVENTAAEHVADHNELHRLHNVLDSGASVPTPGAGDAGKTVTVNGAEDGFVLAGRETAFVKLDGNGLGGIVQPSSTLELAAGSNRMTMSIGPVIAGAGGDFKLRAGYGGNGTVVAGSYHCELTVGNGDGSEVISAANSAVTLASNTVIPVVGGNIDKQVGSDLTIDGDGNIITAAGGAFFVTGYFELTYTPPA